MARPASTASVINPSRTDSAMRVDRVFLSNADWRVSNSLMSGWNWDLVAMMREYEERRLKEGNKEKYGMEKEEDRKKDRERKKSQLLK